MLCADTTYMPDKGCSNTEQDILTRCTSYKLGVEWPHSILHKFTENVAQDANLLTTSFPNRQANQKQFE